MTFQDGDATRHTLRGAYALEDDTWTVCLGKERLAALKAAKDNSLT